LLVDIACGNGRHLIPAAKHYIKVIGIDVSKNLLKIVEEKLDCEKIKNTDLLHSDASIIPLKDETIDIALFIAALHNIKDRINRINTLNELKRILKPDGLALISVWSREQERFKDYFSEKEVDNNIEYGDITLYWKQDKLNVPRFYHLYDKKEFISEIKEAGLKIKNISEEKIVTKETIDNFFAIVYK
jgi:ubiquinone/menaquinone biosynthesis C-methylase UbiE